MSCLKGMLGKAFFQDITIFSYDPVTVTLATDYVSLKIEVPQDELFWFEIKGVPYFIEQASMKAFRSWLEYLPFSDSGRHEAWIPLFTKRKGKTLRFLCHSISYEEDGEYFLMVVTDLDPISDMIKFVSSTEIENFRSFKIVTEDGIINMDNPTLSDDEWICLYYSAYGLPIKSIAKEMCCSTSKVKKQRASICSKLLVRDMAQALKMVEVLRIGSLFKSH